VAYKPKYTISGKILKQIGEIEVSRHVVQTAPLVPLWEAKFREEAVKKTIHHGTHLEGNLLSEEQAEKVIEGRQGEILGRERDVQEVLNYRNVLEFIDKYSFSDYNDKILRKIHQLVVERILDLSESGIYRKVGVVVKNNRTGEVTFRPPPAVAVPVQIKEFFDWLDSREGREDHPVLRAGVTHYELARIHPFLDGNGRTARVMALMVLFEEGYDVKRFLSLDEHYDLDPAKYYEALKTVERVNGDLTFWLEYFCEGLALSLGGVRDRVTSLSRDVRLKSRLGDEQVALSDRQIKIIKLAEKARGRFTTTEAKAWFPMVSKDTVLREINKLVEKGIMVKKGITKGSYYQLKI